MSAETDRPGVVAGRLVVRGRVQGVGYRAWAIDQARLLGLDGWVRNRADGTVEMLAIGPASALDAFIQACHDGPQGARVSAIDHHADRDDGTRGFTWRDTV